MIILKRDEFKKLLEDNPGRKFVFYEYEPHAFMSELHITMGDPNMPTFGAWAPSPSGEAACPFDCGNFEDFYDWSLMEDDENQEYAILEESELNFLESIIAEANVW